MKRIGASDQGKPRFKKWSQGEDEYKSVKVKLEKAGGCQNVKSICVTLGKKQYGEYDFGTASFYGCGKEGHNVRVSRMIASKGKESKQVTLSVPKDDAQTHRRLYALRTEDQSRKRMVIMMRVSPCIFILEI